MYYIGVFISTVLKMSLREPNFSLDIHFRLKPTAYIRSDYNPILEKNSIHFIQTYPNVKS